MIKILHTADWHIGQSFYGYDRTQEHEYFLQWLKKTIHEQHIDVMLVAGDIFDNPNPSAESQKIYYRFLKEVTTENPNLQVVIIAGNHDSSARLEAPNPLLEELNIYIRGTVPKNSNGVEAQKMFVPLTKNGEVQAWCIAVPYLRQGDYPTYESYSNGVKAMYDYLYHQIKTIKTSDQALIFMGHMHVTGSELSDKDRSERTTAGGLDSITPEIFEKEDITYTALGHLHKAQSIANKENIRYAGSPLPMSFTEKFYVQGVDVIEIDKGKIQQIERIKFEPLVKLLSIPEEPKPLDQVLLEIAKLDNATISSTSPYLELKVLLLEPEPSMRHRIEEAVKDKPVRLAITTPYLNKPQEPSSKDITYEEFKALTPMQIAEDVFRNRYAENMPDHIKNLLHKVIQEVTQ